MVTVVSLVIGNTLLLASGLIAMWQVSNHSMDQSIGLVFLKAHVVIALALGVILTSLSLFLLLRLRDRLRPLGLLPLIMLAVASGTVLVMALASFQFVWTSTIDTGAGWKELYRFAKYSVTLGIGGIFATSLTRDALKYEQQRESGAKPPV